MPVGKGIYLPIFQGHHSDAGAQYYPDDVGLITLSLATLDTNNAHLVELSGLRNPFSRSEETESFCVLI